jgi:hypothetical protein
MLFQFQFQFQCLLIPRFLFLSAVFLTFGAFSVSTVDGNEAGPSSSSCSDDSTTCTSTGSNPNDWQDCNIFLAPSSMGWSVYAARSFHNEEIVEISPLFLPILEVARVAKNTILDDYAYGHVRPDKDSGEPVSHHSVLYGMAMFYNHHSVPNVKHVLLGDNGVHVQIGFQARRDIAAGEELLSSYGLEDEGRMWFQQRGLEMSAPDASWIGTDLLDIFKNEFCSKIYAGVGLPTLKDKMQLPDHFPIDFSRIAPFDAGIGDARAKTDIVAGERIDMTIGLPLPKGFVDDTMFAALVINFDDLDVESQESLVVLRNSAQLTIPYKGVDTNWGMVDIFSEDWSTLSILPGGGNIGMVQRVGDDPSSNCRLHINWQGSNGGSAGILMELFATENIASSEVLKLNMKPADSVVGYELLKAELDEQGGHSYVASYFPDPRKE